MKQLIKELISVGSLKTPLIIDAFQKIDRADFVPDETKEEAYVDTALPIGYGQTISQPLTVVFMLELLQPEKGNKILEVGSGSGWQTALLSYIVSGENEEAQSLFGDKVNKGEVYAIELIPELVIFGKKNVSKYSFIKKGITKFHCFNATKGIPEEAPFDRIISAASGQDIPEAWKEQLKVGGRMVVPIGKAIHLFIKNGKNKFEEKIYPGFTFVPFIS